MRSDVVEVTHIPATMAHVVELAAIMREADRREIWASDRQLPLGALSISLRESEKAWSTFFGGEIAMMYGVRRIPAAESAMMIWFLSSTVVDRHPITFWRACKEGLPRLLDEYPVLCNMVDARYEQSVRWVRRLGFQIKKEEPFGPDGVPFHFVIRRANANSTRKGAEEGRSQDGAVQEAEKEKGRDHQRSARSVRVRDPSKARLETPA
jgi:hypothetical protein